ncbi:MAG: hypothetical protein ACREDU_13310, partial [Methylocella sp.]
MIMTDMPSLLILRRDFHVDELVPGAPTGDENNRLRFEDTFIRRRAEEPRASPATRHEVMV